jgi:hypothetical protein
MVDGLVLEYNNVVREGVVCRIEDENANEVWRQLDSAKARRISHALTSMVESYLTQTKAKRSVGVGPRPLTLRYLSVVVEFFAGHITTYLYHSRIYLLRKVGLPNFGRSFSQTESRHFTQQARLRSRTINEHEDKFAREATRTKRHGENKQ